MIVDLLIESRIYDWLVEPIGWQNYHLKVAHVILKTKDEGKVRDLQYDLENPDEFTSAMREIVNFPFPKGILVESKYISNDNSQHLQTTHCNLLCKNSLKVNINLLKKPIHLYITAEDLFQRRLQIIKDVMKAMSTEQTGMAWEYEKQNCCLGWLNREASFEKKSHQEIRPNSLT